MTKVAIYREEAGPDEMAYHALAGRNLAVGRTPGEALDALTTQLRREDADTLIIVRNLGPDRFFTAEQRQRLEQLMAAWRVARDGGKALSSGEQAELEDLVAAEVRAATERAAAVLRELAP
jgi:hypothetical protein